MMDQTWLHLLSLSGLLSLTLCKPHEYVLIQELMSWENAQDYCRKNHIDLATVQSDEDWTNLKEVAVEKGFYGFAWIGLYDDINSWRWSYQDESLEFEFWYPGQPDNYGAGPQCVAIYSDGTWSDYGCDNTRYFVCSDESANATEKLVLIKTGKTWLDAQKYCRQHHTDLVTIRSQDVDYQIAILLSFMDEAWIGLYRDSWKWSDQANFTSSTELAVQKLIGVKEDCAGTDYYRTTDDRYCTDLQYFYCSTDNPFKEDKIENILITHYHYSDKTMGKMDQMWLHLLSLSGLLSLTLCKPHEYVLIQELVMWKNAQDYCRKNHIDLATVQSDEDWTNLKEVAVEKGFYGFAWIGLYDDINSWRWSYQDESLEFKSWYPGQPDNYGTGEECVAIYSDGYWRDYRCDNTRYFVCSDESANATEKMALIKTEKTWLDAQKYCRQHYTDLVTIRSQDDNIKVARLTNYFCEPWIGLYRDSWKWSDQANFTSSTQLAVQRLNLMNEDCAAANYYRTIEDDYCTALHYFYCSTVKKKQQVIRVQVKASENADDATLSALVLRKLQQTLGDQDVTLTWKKQPNGKVFQKKKTVTKKSSNASTPVCSRSSM